MFVVKNMPMITHNFSRRYQRRNSQISSSKYVAQQRLKARQIVDLIEKDHLKLIAFDFDRTLLSIHTHGDYQGTIDYLIEHIRSTFSYLIEEILNSSLFNQTIFLCIVTFSPQDKLIRQLLRQAFQNPNTDKIMICSNTPEFYSTIKDKPFCGKEYHLASVRNQIAMKYKRILKPDEILLFDDDVQNILVAEKFGHRVLEIRDDINLEVLRKFFER